MGIKIKQHDDRDCGAAALASVCIHYKLQIPIARIRQYANTDRQGTNMLGLIEAARVLGFTAKGVRANVENLIDLHLPAIAHVIIREKFPHYVVLYKVTEQYVQIMDPQYGDLKKVSINDFAKSWTGLIAILIPGENFKPGKIGSSKSERLLSLLKPSRFSIVQIIVGSILYTVLGISTSLYIEKITDSVIPNYNGNLMNLLSMIMLFTIGVQLVIGFFRAVLTLKVGQIIDARLILGYYQHLTRMKQSFFDNMRVGEIVSRINDAVKIRSFINEVAINFFVNVCIVIFSFILMYTYYWKMALIMTLCIPFYILLYIISNHINKKNVRTVMENSADLESQLVESINSMQTIKQFGLEEYANLKTEEKFIDLLKSTYKVNYKGTGIAFASDGFARIFTVILFWAGTYYIFKNELTPGELFSFYALISYFTGPIEQLVSSNRQIQEAVIASDRLFEFMDLEIESDAKGSKITLIPGLIGDIRFESISFRYGSRAKIFEDVSFAIPAKQFTAIVGVSGSGKSTLMGILQKIYPLSAGKVFIGDCDLQYVSNQSLRSTVSVVPQSINLFAGSILENITIGDAFPNIEKVIQICKQLRILDFIQTFPQGLETYVGENGVALSEGQKQRIGIARALYRDFEILIMDEATSSLDSFSDSYVQDVIKELKLNNKTIIVITHRLSSIAGADHIMVLNNGKIIETGNHQQLTTLNGYYSALWKNQV